MRPFASARSDSFPQLCVTRVAWFNCDRCAMHCLFVYSSSTIAPIKCTRSFLCMVSGHLQLHTLSGNSGLSKFKHGIVRLVERRGAPRDAWFIHLKQKNKKCDVGKRQPSQGRILHFNAVNDSTHFRSPDLDCQLFPPEPKTGL